jgi:hypothetical protein
LALKNSEKWDIGRAEPGQYPIFRSLGKGLAWLNSYRAAGIVIYIVLVTLGLYRAFSHWGYDDPFITYRYAENLRQGLGFVYNPGEYLQSTTSPLFALLLSLLSIFWCEIHSLANLVGAFSIAVSGVLLSGLGRSWKLPWLGAAGLLLYPSFPLLLSTLSSETPLYLALCIGALATYTRRSYSWAALFSALAILARPDGILVPAVLGLHYGLRQVGILSALERRAPLVGPGEDSPPTGILSRIPWKAILIFLFISASWFLFAWIYFGTPLPVTLSAKQAQGAMAISERFLPGIVTIARWYSSWPYRVEAVLFLLGLFLLPGRGKPVILMLAWTVLYFAAYSLLAISRYFWYYAPLVPGFIAGVGLGFSFIARDWAWFAGHPLGKRIPQALAAFVLALLFLGQLNSFIGMRGNNDNRLLIYRSVGEWLAANTLPDQTVGALEVGIIGFYARRPMVDFAGLIQPDVAAQFGPETTYADTALWAVNNYQPDYVVLHAGLFPQLETGYIADFCQPETVIEGENYQYPHDMVIYSCRAP